MSKDNEHLEIPVSDLRERILVAARQLFYEMGFFETKTRTIATRAGTSESGLFRIFDNKYNILMAVYNQSWGVINNGIKDALEKVEIKDPREKIILIIRTLWEHYQSDHLTIAFVIMNTGNTDTLLIERKEHASITEQNSLYINRIESLCDECFQKKLGPKQLTARSLCEGVLGISEGVLLGWYLADKSKGNYQNKISSEEAIILIKMLIYGKYNE